MSIEEPMTEAQRMVNLGADFESKRFGKKITVKELSLESIIKCASELSKLLVLFPASGTADPASMLKLMLSSSATVEALRLFAAESTGTKSVDWLDVPVGDWVKFIRCVKRVNDKEELKQLFTELGLAKFLSSQPVPEMSNEESPTLRPG